MAIGIIATPASVAQEIADRLVAAGITSVLNFAPSVVTVPDGASLRKVDLASELQILSFYQQRRSPPPGRRRRRATDGAGRRGPAPTAARRRERPARANAMIDEPLYPVHLRLAGRRCLVVGGGPVAARKARGLVECGADGHRGGPRGGRRARRALDGVTCERRPYRAGEVAGYRLVVAATDDPDVDGRVFRDGERHGVWVNAADDPDHCSVMLPAVVRRGPIVATFSTSGRSPAMATWLRRRYEDELGPEYLVAARPAGRASATGSARPRVGRPRALIGNRPSTRECWTSSARATSPKPRSASRRVCRRHRAEPPHRAARPARADDDRRVAPRQGPPRRGRPRARERGGRALDLQPHRDLRGGREVPRRLRRRARLPLRAGLPAARGLQRPPLRRVRRGGGRPPVRGHLGARLGGDRRGRDPRPGARRVDPGAGGAARSARRST